MGGKAQGEGGLRFGLFQEIMTIPDVSKGEERRMGGKDLNSSQNKNKWIPIQTPPPQEIKTNQLYIQFKNQQKKVGWV